MAERIIPEKEYNEWNQKAKQARLEIRNRDEAVAAVDEATGGDDRRGGGGSSRK